MIGACESASEIPVDLTISTLATPLTAAEVSLVIQAAAEAIDDETQTIAVVDRAGTPLGVFSKSQASARDQEVALSLARTGAFFSNDQAPLSSRTVGFISREHFPPGVSNTPSGALFDIEQTNRGCPLNAPFATGRAINPATALDGVSRGLGITVMPGGVPLFRNGRVVGGLGVAGVSVERAEFSAVQGLSPFPPTPAEPGVIFVDGVGLPFILQTTRPDGSNPGTFTGTFVLGPVNGGLPPEGDLVTPRDSPTNNDPRLTASEVQNLIDQGKTTADRTRAAIRLPLGQRTKMAIAVADTEGNILGLHRMTDSTIFSIDVAVAKARNVAYFSSTRLEPEDQLPGVPAGTAISNRTLGFAAQPFFPSGIDGTDPGPLRGLLEFDATNPCTQGRQPANANQNGIVFFPGSSPLYKPNADGDPVLVGGVGVSGDGVDQDDYVTAGSIVGFEPPASLRADQFSIGDVRLPFFKFPRNPED